MKRWKVLRKLIRAKGVARMVEVGVKSGAVAAHILPHHRTVVMYAVDPWAPTEAYKDWPDRHHDKHERLFDRKVELFQPRLIKMKMLSLQAATLFEPESVDLVFLDGDHTYEGVRTDIEAWLPKIRPGGALSGHDYKHTFPGVTKAVDEVFPQVNTDVDHVWWVDV